MASSGAVQFVKGAGGWKKETSVTGVNLGAKDYKEESMIKPLDARVVVRVVDQTDRKSAAGIILPETMSRNILNGVVTAVGPGRILQDGTLHKVNMKVGDTIMFSIGRGLEFSIEGVRHWWLTEDECLGVVG